MDNPKNKFNFWFDIQHNFSLEMLAFFFQRVTGILLVFYLFLHLFVIGTAATIGKEAFDKLMEFFEKPPFPYLEFLLLVGVLYHLLNGIRIVLVDFFAMSKAQKDILWVIAVIGVVVGIISLYMFLPKFQGI